MERSSTQQTPSEQIERTHVYIAPAAPSFPPRPHVFHDCRLAAFYPITSLHRYNCDRNLTFLTSTASDRGGIWSNDTEEESLRCKVSRYEKRERVEFRVAVSFWYLSVDGIARCLKREEKWRD